jgi:hypothetical protein
VARLRKCGVGSFACSKGLLRRSRKSGRLPTIRHRKIVVSTMKRGFERDTSLHGSENGPAPSNPVAAQMKQSDEAEWCDDSDSHSEKGYLERSPGQMVALPLR